MLEVVVSQEPRTGSVIGRTEQGGQVMLIGVMSYEDRD